MCSYNMSWMKKIGAESSGLFGHRFPLAWHPRELNYEVDGVEYFRVPARSRAPNNFDPGIGSPCWISMPSSLRLQNAQNGYLTPHLIGVTVAGESGPCVDYTSGPILPPWMDAAWRPARARVWTRSPLQSPELLLQRH